MKKVLVLGGGYGGLRAVESLSKYDNIEITLIDKNPYHYLQTEAYGYIAGRFDVHDIAIDLSNWSLGFKRVTFIQTEVDSVDFEASSISIKDEKLVFDYIIIAVGAKTNFFSFIKGLRENSYGVKNLDRAFNFKKEFENAIYSKLQNRDNSCSKESLNIAIGGAGLSGVEVAAEMADVVKHYSKAIGESAKEIKIYLIDASETILPGTSQYLVKNTHQRLEELGVNILTNAFISSVNESEIIFKNGDKLEYCFMIFTGGIIASKFNDSVSCEKNRLNQFIPDKTLNILDSQNIFAIGDCAEIRDSKDNILPPTAQTAERSAEYVAKVIRDRIDGVASKEFEMSMMGIFVALGGSYAVGEMFNLIKVKGYPAYLLKKAITYAYYIGLRLRINTGFKNRSVDKR